jgi:hypothetical protein
MSVEEEEEGGRSGAFIIIDINFNRIGGRKMIELAVHKSVGLP